ncbi:MAG: hypothetical protein JNG88_17170 [Phycisphaerales bacterium]|nr:hypothetical protein [Phycisphaerales bacterium]
MYRRLRLRPFLVFACALLAPSVLSQSGGQYQIAWSSIDSGSAIVLSGADFETGCTAGEHDPSVRLTGGDFEVISGFWPGVLTDYRRPADMNCDGLVNSFDIDGFVLAITDPIAYSALFRECNINNADGNGDGLINSFDIDPFVTCLVNNGCP